jgi:voltage-gated potassium channel
MAAETTDRAARRQAIQQRARARHELQLFVRRLGILLCALLVMILVGTAGYALIEGTSGAFGLVWTIDTLTTVGGIPDPPDAAGRALKVGLELLGIGTLFYGLATVAEFFVSGQLSGLLDERRTQRVIDSYSDHFIICGFGRVGRQAARDLRQAGVRHVAVDSDPGHRELASSMGVRYIENEAADDEVLLKAGIERARALIACVDSDAENIFIALTARGLRPDLLIVARASAEDSEKKLRQAGADRVISPYKTSGSEMARIALHPQVGGAVQVADYRMEEIDATAGSEGVGKTIQAVRGESVIVAIRHTDGRLEPQPAPGNVIEAGDMLVAIGSPAALEQLESAFQPVGMPSS